MTEIYSEGKPKNQKESLGPRKETIAFLLNYSKALSVNKYKGKKYEMLLN